MTKKQIATYSILAFLLGSVFAPPDPITQVAYSTPVALFVFFTLIVLGKREKTKASDIKRKRLIAVATTTIIILAAWGIELLLLIKLRG